VLDTSFNKIQWMRAKLSSTKRLPSGVMQESELLKYLQAAGSGA
jgi:hypothetical protein